MFAQKLPLIPLLCLPVVCSPASQAKETTNQEAEQVVTLFHTKPVSFEQLTKQADRIFIGKVIDVRVKSEPIDDEDPQVMLPVRTVTCTLQEVLKGNLKKGGRCVVRQYVPICSPVKKGEVLLWYLAPNSKLGLTQPVGIHSGHFIVSRHSTPDNADGAETYDVAINLKSNRGLWKDYLWDKTVTPDKFTQRLKALETSNYVINEIIIPTNSTSPCLM